MTTRKFTFLQYYFCNSCPRTLSKRKSYERRLYSLFQKEKIISKVSSKLTYHLEAKKKLIASSSVVASNHYQLSKLAATHACEAAKNHDTTCLSLEAEANGEGPLWPQLSRSEGHMQVYWQEANKQRSSNKLSKVPLKLHASPLS